MTRLTTRRRSAKAEAAALAAARAEAAKVHLRACPHMVGYFVDAGEGRVTRCPCWERYQQALKDPVEAPLPFDGRPVGGPS